MLTVMVDCACMHNRSVNQTQTDYITTRNHLAVHYFLFDLSKLAGYMQAWQKYQTFPLIKQN